VTVKQLDPIGWFIVTLHQMIGHRAAANFIGEPVEEGAMARCVLCQYEKGETTKADVIERLGVEL